MESFISDYPMIFIMGVIVWPASIVIYTLKDSAYKFKPKSLVSSSDFNTDPHIFSSLSISLVVFVYFNIFRASDVFFSSSARIVATWLVFSLSLGLSIFLSTPPETRPLWSPINWPTSAGLIVAVLSFIRIGISMSTEIYNNPQGYGSIGIILSVIVYMFMLVIMSSCIYFAVKIIFMAQLSFSITGLMISLLFAILHYIDTGIIDYMAYYEKITNFIFARYQTKKWSDLFQIIFIFITISSSIVTLVEYIIEYRSVREYSD